MRSTVVCSWMLLGATILPARGDEPKIDSKPNAPPGEAIVVCGAKIPIGTRVILWTDPGGHNAYERKSSAAHDPKVAEKAASPGFGLRRQGLSEGQLAQIQQSGWTRPLLEQTVDQFVIHYDVCGTSQKCFEVLQQRNLSVHFMLDLDGTLYQTLDLKEAAYHATKANGRSIGIEIANMGAYPVPDLASSPLGTWYEKAADGRTKIRLPNPSLIPTRSPDAEPLQPSRNEPVVGMVQGQQLAMYDLTPQQYAALTKLTAGLCATFPKIRYDFPRDGQGQVINHKLDDDVYKSYQGILGHFHVQLNKTDPGPAFQWDRIVNPEKAPKQP